jgi:hypothetical protein
VLDLYFETPDQHVDARGGHRYVLYRDGLGYPLPDVVLATQEGTATVALREVAIAEIEPADGADLRPNSRTTLQLRDMIRDAWAPLDRSGPGHVPVRHVVAENRAVPADVVEAARTTDSVVNPQALVSVDVTWRWLYTDDRGLPEHGTGKARLEFAPANSTPPPRHTTLDPEAERRGVPAPVRHIGNRPSYRHFAAVDFGTSTSTVTLYDTRTRFAHRMDPGQAKVLSAAIIRLLRSAAPEQLQPRWEKTVTELLTRVGHDYSQLAGAPLDALCRRLESTQLDSGNADRLLEIVCACLDRLAAEEQAAPDKSLARWLGPQVLGCYDEAFDHPPLATLNLWPVDFGPPHRYEVPTELTISTKAPVAIEFGTGGVDAVRNLKSKLGEAEPLEEGTKGEDGADATTDNLIALVYRDLVERTEKFARGDDPDAPDEALTHLVVTFPTITPAGARQHLTALLEYTLGLKEVSVKYDEGVAAALYFLMRDFGGTRAEFGAEALRARSEHVQSDPPEWQQNMLVIDIGAGTTDIALVRLTLLENDSPIAGVDPNVQGKYYIVQPEVMNSTGHSQLGGNYLTLRVFYWLKAAIVDAMLNGQGHEAKRAELAREVRDELELDPQDEIPGLADLVAQAGDVESPVPQQVSAALNRVLPTQWGPNADSTAKDAFWSLWTIAEPAKIALGADPTDYDDGYVVSHDEIVGVLTNIDVKMSKEREPLIPSTGVRLDRAGFQALARPVIAHAAELAWWLVQQSLGSSKPDRLDRVMLSGKTSMMELTRHVIAEELGSASTGSRVAWNPTAISVERTYAKQAASIGAAWAAQIRARGAGTVGDKDLLAKGRSVLKINVDNVYSSLPCEFVQLRAGEGTSSLFAAGTPLVEIDKAGTLAARQEWTEQEGWPVLLPSFEVHRPVQPGKTQVWGTYRFEHDAKDERGFNLDRRIWLPSSMGDAGARIRAQVQIDQRLNPTLNICHGRPHYLIASDDPVAVRDLRAELPDDAWDQIERRLRTMPASIVIVGAKDERHKDGEYEFPVWRPQPDGLVSDYFPDYFHEHAGLDSETVSGRIAFDLPLPSLPYGTYRLLLRDPDTGADRDLGEIRVPEYGERTVRYTATLDLRGRFTLHRGSPPYWMAGTLRDVQTHQGAVLFRAMEPGKANRNPKWDPFTGKH